MKKKKLKKKIKHLEKAVENMGYRCDNWAMVARETRDNTTKYGAKVNQLNADISNYGRIINEHASRISVLEKKDPKNEKTCDTCKWKPLMEQGGQDIPCMGCTANDKKMWKSKET